MTISYTAWHEHSDSATCDLPTALLAGRGVRATTNEQSLLGNLRTLVPEDWLLVPPGGHRSIRDIVRHVGGCKFMYHDYAFGGATLTWEDPLVDGC